MYIGNKIYPPEIFDKLITIFAFRIGPSKFKERGYDRCIHMQIEVDGVKKVLFSGSKNLCELADEIDKDKLPLTTTIIKRENKSFSFV